MARVRSLSLKFKEEKAPHFHQYTIGIYTFISTEPIKICNFLSKSINKGKTAAQLIRLLNQYRMHLQFPAVLVKPAISHSIDIKLSKEAEAVSMDNLLTRRVIHALLKQIIQFLIETHASKNLKEEINRLIGENSKMLQRLICDKEKISSKKKSNPKDAKATADIKNILDVIKAQKKTNSKKLEIKINREQNEKLLLQNLRHNGFRCHKKELAKSIASSKFFQKELDKNQFQFILDPTAHKLYKIREETEEDVQEEEIKKILVREAISPLAKRG